MTDDDDSLDLTFDGPEGRDEGHTESGIDPTLIANRSWLDSDVEELMRSGPNGTLVSHFRIIRRLGRGGFGAVYLADDTRLNRRVAVKIAHRVHDDDADKFYSRVMREGRAAAKLDHPHIVPIFEVAVHQNRPLIVAKFIDGETLAQRLQAGRFSAPQAARLCFQIATAVGYANRQGIIHRDLKPGNILLDSDGSPYVTDFGLAKHESVEETISGDSGQLGTPAYMSPEQAAGLSHSVDGRSDLYAIGVILFELLTGERPFRGNAKMLMHHVIFDEAPSLRSLIHTIPRDLETICLKCLQKDRQRRYATCDDLAAELERFSDGKPILARPISKVQQAARWCLRHRQVTSLAMAFVLSLIVGLTGVTWQWIRAEKNAKNERLARVDADRANQQLDIQFRETKQLLYNSRLSLVEQAVEVGRYQRIKELLAPFEAPNSFEPLDFEYFYFRHLQSLLRNQIEHTEPTTDLCFHADNQTLAVAGLRTVLIVDSETGKPISTIRGHREKVHRVAFVPGTDLVATASEDGSVKFWNFKSGNEAGASLETQSSVRAIDFNGTTGTVALGHANGEVTIWNVSKRNLVQRIAAHDGVVTAVKFIHDGSHCVSCGDDFKVAIWDAQAGVLHKELASIRSPVTAMDVHEADDWIVAGFSSGRFRVWKLDGTIAFTSTNTLAGPIGDITSLNEGLFAMSGLAGQVQVRDSHSGKLRFFMPTHSDSFGIHAITRDQRSFAAGGDDGTTKIFDINLERNVTVRHVGDSEIHALLFLGATDQWIGLGDNGAITVARCDHFSKQGSLDPSSATYSAMESSLDGKYLCLGTIDGQIDFYDVDTRKIMHGIAIGPKSITQLSLLQDDKTVVIGCDDGTVSAWKRGDESCGKPLFTHRGSVTEITSSFDGQIAYSVGLDGVIFAYDSQTGVGKSLATLSEAIHSIAVNHDNTEIAVGLANGTVERWNLLTQMKLATLRGHVGPVQAIVYCPSGKTLVTAANDRIARLWDLHTGETKIKLSGHNRAIRRIAMSQDGTRLLTGDAMSQVFQWDAPRE